MRRIVRYLPLWVILSLGAFICGWLLFIPVKREWKWDRRDDGWYTGERLPKPYRPTLLAMQNPSRGLFDQGWPWAYGMSLIANNTKTGQDEWVMAEFNGWILAADVGVLLLALVALAWLTLRHYHRRSGWLAFSMREMLVATTLVAVAIGWWASHYRSWKREQERLVQFNSAEKEYRGPEWLLRFVSASSLPMFQRAVSASFDTHYNNIRPPVEDRLKVLIESLPNLPYVQQLHVAGVPLQMTDPSVFSQIEFLSIDDSGFEDDMLQDLRQWPRLRQLYIGDLNVEPNISDRGLEMIGRCHNLERLWISHAFRKVGDDGVAPLGQLTQLRELNLLNTYLTDKGIVHFSGLTQLREFELSATYITDAATETLSQLLSLESLRLAHCEKLTDQGIARLTPLKNLRFLDLAYTNVTDAVVESLAKMPSLKEVDLSECPKITDRGLRRLLQLPNLREIHFLNHPKLSDETSRLLEEREKDGLILLNAELAHL
jgi:Leucine-rich repeat (LRR) protein